MCSSFARSKLQSQKDPINNSTVNGGSEMVDGRRPTPNGVNKAVVPPVATTSASMIIKRMLKLHFKTKKGVQRHH